MCHGIGPKICNLTAVERKQLRFALAFKNKSKTGYQKNPQTNFTLVYLEGIEFLSTNSALRSN